MLQEPVRTVCGKSGFINKFLFSGAVSYTHLDVYKRQVDTGADNAAGKLTFNIDGLAREIAPLRDACHWAGE